MRRMPRPRRRPLLVAAIGVAGIAIAGAAAGLAEPDQPAPKALDGPPATASTTSFTTTSSTTTSSTTTSSTTTTTTAPPPPPAPPATPPGAPALCIGDSVMLGAGPSFANTLTMCGTVDATENRQFHQADDAAALHLLAGAGTLPHTVVVQLGNNGFTSAAEIDRLLEVLAPAQRVVFVTVQLQHARQWQDAVNAEIRAASQRHPTTVVVADWQAATEGHPEWFTPDGIHISGNPAGALVFAATVLAAL